MKKKLKIIITAIVAIAVIGIVIGLILTGTVGSPHTKTTQIQGNSGTQTTNSSNVKTVGNTSTNQSGDFFTLRTPLSSSLAVIDLADQLGYYRDNGIIIERTGTSTGGPQNIMTVASGSNDVGGSAFSAIVNAIAKGTKIKVVVPSIGTSLTEPDYKWLVLNTSSIKTASDLKGKTIGVNTLGAQADFVTRAYLYQHNLTPSDVQLVVLPIENEEQVLRQGQVDVIAPNGNYLKKAESDGGVRALFTDAEVTGDQVKSATFMSTDFIEEHPDIVRKFVNATTRAIEWDKQNRDQSKVLLAEYLEKNNGNTKLAALHNGWAIRSPPTINDQDVQFWVDVMVKEGLLKEGQIKPSDVYTNEFNPYYQK
ncbi:ABC transporter substrate-binding protein [Methanosphaerula palustris]|uniref:NMT1/THI5 like domain protein n=1 Tax=Methanosphaerula palustris (strain ATCC BAA-1556 / DSM 19958 / E1-9c) TaxID=521011 RepID=B8GH72_METPE|nr:ABC transporter substrate-binding protein [Methanosphaerula palustris]ACL16477.1 NMT1/THI5 like domain protein [Methanosphaerula palustris E1-9c]